MSSTDEEKIATVRRFSDQMMAAVLDNHEVLLFDRIEEFFNSRAEIHYKQGFNEGFTDGWNAAVITARRLQGED